MQFPAVPLARRLAHLKLIEMYLVNRVYRGTPSDSPVLKLGELTSSAHANEAKHSEVGLSELTTLPVAFVSDAIELSRTCAAIVLMQLLGSPGKRDALDVRRWGELLAFVEGGAVPRQPGPSPKPVIGQPELVAPQDSLDILNRRMAELVEELGLEALGLDEAAIQELATKKDGHKAVCKRFADARQTLGLSSLEPALHAYQRTIGAVGQKSWTRDEKDNLRLLLKAVADSLVSYFLAEGFAGNLEVYGRGEGTFRLRTSTGGKQATLNLTEGLPLFSLRPAPPSSSKKIV